MRAIRLLGVAAAASFVLGACAPATLGPTGDYSDHDEPSDFAALIVGGAFDRHDVVSDSFFRNDDLLSATDIQLFLERTPYGRCFLADETIGERTFAEVLHDVAIANDVNPLLLLARMQVEGSLISRETRPSGDRLDFAFGCGCYDGRPCMESYRGLDRQLTCGAQTHDTRYEDSVTGVGGWRRGHARRTLDGYSVTPANHATAALYAYTPHVGLRNGRVRGGNALVHNVLQRFADRLIELGIATREEIEGPRPAWIGSACVPGAATCDELGEVGARCQPAGDAGFCTAGCEGYCPDRAGYAPTFCVDIGGAGACVSKADPLNSDCVALPGTERRMVSRFVGASGAPATTAVVCYPVPGTPSPEPAPTDPEPSEPEPEPTLCSDTCRWAGDGECDDGGPGSSYSVCDYGTDCADCGPR